MDTTTTLPMDIILSCILPKLPAKSLIRFKCVSKSFLAEISSPKFIKLQHHNAISSNSNRLLILPLANKGIYMYDLDSPHSQPSFCPYPKVTFFALYKSILATCEGNLLIGCGLTTLSDLFLLNPSTRTYREICSKGIPRYDVDAVYGLWHSQNDYDEYKVVRFFDFYTLELEVMVYNTTTDMWKMVEPKTTLNTFTLVGYKPPVVVQNHLLHLLFYNSSYHIKRIGCFDIKDERWANDLELPDILWDVSNSGFAIHRPWNFGELNDQLCFTGYNVVKSSIDLWVMKEYGVQESWVKLISSPNFSVVDSEQFWQESYYCPLGYRTNSLNELLYIKSGFKLYWYNLIDKEEVKAEFAEFPPPPRVDGYKLEYRIYICKGSLLNFPGGESIRVSLEDEDGYEDEEEEEEEEDNDDEDFVI